MGNTLLAKKKKLKEGEIIKLSYDEAFKIMFANPEHLSILTMLLSKILQVKYETIEGKVSLLPLRFPNKTIGEKKAERDVVVSIKSDQQYKIILEVNMSYDFYETVINRNLHYLNDVASSGFRESSNYKELPTTFLINFNNFKTSNKEKIFDEYLYRNEEGEVLTEKNKILNIDIEKCYQLWYNQNNYEVTLNGYEKDLLLLSAALKIDKEEDFKRCLEKVKINKRIKKEIEEVLFEMCQDEELVGRYYAKETEERRIREGIYEEIKERATAKGLEEGIQKGLEKGIEQGIEKTKREMVIAMYNQKADYDFIATVSGLSIEEIKNIINNK